MTKELRLLIAAIILSSWTTPARAIDDSSRAATRALVNEGVAHFKANRFEEARSKFMDALAVAKVPTIAVWAAQAHEKLGRLVAASELYRSAVLMQPNELWLGNAQQQAQQQAREALTALTPRIPAAKIELVGAESSQVEVSIDKVTVPAGLLAVERILDPGPHVVTATRAGQTLTEKLVLTEAEKKVVRLDFSAASPSIAPGSATPPTTSKGPLPGQRVTAVQAKPESSGTQRTLAWVGLGVGAAGLALGTTAAVLVVTKRSSLHSDGCEDNNCYGSTFNDRVDSYNTWRKVSTVGFVVGGVGAVAGVTLLLLKPKQESAPSVSLVMAPSAMGFHGAF
jgi:hypothetical protein